MRIEEAPYFGQDFWFFSSIGKEQIELLEVSSHLKAIPQ